MKLQTKILAILIPVIALPLLLLGWVSYNRLGAYSEKIQLERMDTLLDQISRQVSTKIATVRANSALFANAKQLYEYALAKDEADRYDLFQQPLLRLFATYQKAYPEYFEIRVLLPDGFEDTRLAPIGLANVTEKEGATPLFEKIRSHAESYLTSFGFNPDDNRVVLWSVRKLILTDRSIDPLGKKPELRGYLVLTVAWPELQKHVDGTQLGQGGYLLFTDSRGRILFQSQRIDHRAKVEPANFQRVLKNAGNAQKLTVSVDGEPYLADGRRIHKDLYLLAFIPMAELQQERDHLATLLSMTLLMVILLSTSLTLWFFRSVILHPVRKLNLAFQEVGKGVFSRQLSAGKNDEIGALEHEFNRMTRRLKNVTVSRDYVSQIIQQLQDALLVLDPDGRIETINNAALEMSGYLEEELAGEPVACLFPAEDPWLVDWLLSQVTITNIEREFVTVTGTHLPVLLSATTIEDERTGAQRAILLIRDISSHKEAEAEKERLKSKLHRAHKMEAIGTLAGGVAHDLNNILSGLTSYPEVLLLDLPPDSPIRKPLQVMKKSGDRAVSIVQDLLTLARRGVQISSVLDLNAIVHDYLESHEYNQIIKYHEDIIVARNLHSQPALIEGSAAQLTKVLNNLVSNAAEALPGGGGIVVQTEIMTLDQDHVGYERIPVGKYACLDVGDTGIGIAPTDLDRIFEPFFTKKVMGRSGTGLGMAVVWGTVKDHGGYVDVNSTEGEGTNFRIYLPITDKPIRTGLADPQELIIGNGERILVVDDVEEQRTIAASMLKRLNYTVDCVANGESAVEYVRNKEADLIILDMIMAPGIDGLDTYKRIASYREDQRVVVASGFSETSRVETLLRMSSGIYLKKPYSMEELGAAVRQGLEK